MPDALNIPPRGVGQRGKDKTPRKRTMDGPLAQIRFPADLYAFCESRAAAQGISFSEYVRLVLQSEMAQSLIV